MSDSPRDARLDALLEQIAAEPPAHLAGTGPPELASHRIGADVRRWMQHRIAAPARTRVHARPSRQGSLSRHPALRAALALLALAVAGSLLLLTARTDPSASLSPSVPRGFAAVAGPERSARSTPLFAEQRVALTSRPALCTPADRRAAPAAGESWYCAWVPRTDPGRNL